MKRITLSSLACLGLLLIAAASPVAAGTPNPNGAEIKTRIFNNCPFTQLNVVNNYPSAISIEDVGLACSGFANRHAWSFSEDGGATSARFDNDADFRMSADVKLEGISGGEAGLRFSPWWSKDVDGVFMLNANSGEIACFGGRLPFYSFTVNYGLQYTKGDVARLEMTYKPNGLSSTSPATMEYRITYNGITYTSGPLAYDMGNPAEDPPHGLWGNTNDGRAGGYVQANFVPGNFSANFKTTFTNIRFVICPTEPHPSTAVVKTRVFNDCPFTNLTVTENYPSLISFRDQGLACSGFANLHVWTYADGAGKETVLGNDSDFRIATDVVITGRGEGGLRVSPWWGKDTDGLFNVRTTDGEIAVFGGRLPFYSFSNPDGANQGPRYQAGNSIHLEMTYRHNGLSSASPGTIVYSLTYQGQSYTSGVLNFDMGNPAEDPPYGLWGILNDARAGGHFKAFMSPGDFTATSQATFTNMEFQGGLIATVDVDPNALRLRASGRWVTAYIEPPAPYTADQIDVHSLRMNGVAGPDQLGSAVLGDHDGDGIGDLAVKFSRITVGEFAGDGVVTITGEVAGQCFSGSDHVRLLGVLSPTAGATVTRGGQATISWAQVPGNTADLYYSLDNGDSWEVVALGVPNTGSHGWSVPNQDCSAARVAVVVNDGTAEGVSGVSGVFTISSPVGVGDGDGDVAFALKGASPNPTSADRMNIAFSLPDGKRATLGLFDISGRRLASREVGTLGAGRHTVTLAERLRPGIYMLRLDREGVTLKTRATVVR